LDVQTGRLSFILRQKVFGNGLLCQPVCWSTGKPELIFILELQLEGRQAYPQLRKPFDVLALTMLPIKTERPLRLRKVAML